MSKTDVKGEVAEYWNEEACGTNVAKSQKFTRKYFEEIEEYRYRIEPEIFSFAQFTRFHGKEILEVGVGAGTDFMQWVRAGARAHGVDLTQEAVDHVRQRLSVFGLAAEEVRVADAENLPFPDASFDLVYSWGVIHHSPNTVRALEEIIRCTRPGGTIKIMVYNRRSLQAFYKYLRFGLGRGRPLRSISDIMYHHQESPGTKAYTIAELKQIVKKYPVEITSIAAKATYYDLLLHRHFVIRSLAYLLAAALGREQCGFYLTMELKKQ